MAAYEEGYDYDPQYTETDYDTSVAPGNKTKTVEINIMR